MVATYPGSPVGGVSWCVGNSETFTYETEVGERFGEGREHFAEERHTWTQRNLHSLMESSGGPMQEIIRQFHEAGIDVLPSLRMNSHYDTPYHSPGHGRFRRDHPGWLIGQPHEYIPRPTLEYAIARGVDYKFPGVREHMAKIVFELCERFDVDGIELDYFRHPAFFRIEEACSNRYLMTDFVRRIRRRLDEVGEKRGRHLDLLVRVPPTLYDARRIGLDVETWISEGLVDIVAAGGGFMPFEQPIREFVEAAEGTDCLIYGSLEALRWALDEEVLYALAARFWEAGGRRVLPVQLLQHPERVEEAGPWKHGRPAETPPPEQALRARPFRPRRQQGAPRGSIPVRPALGFAAGVHGGDGARGRRLY